MKLTIEEMANEVIKWFEEATPDEIKAFKENDTIEYHHGLGRQIRNHFKLWSHDWEPKIIDGVDFSDEHPDSISSRVLKEVQSKLKSIDKYV